MTEKYEKAFNSHSTVTLDKKDKSNDLSVKDHRRI